jgi:hypothetical protein
MFKFLENVRFVCKKHNNNYVRCEMFGPSNDNPVELSSLFDSPCPGLITGLGP